jgi:hypothetical protein
VEQSSYEDDLQILRVIEAYCTSKQRQTITNSGEAIYIKSREQFVLSDILTEQYFILQNERYLPEDHLSLNASHLVQLFGSIHDRRKA